MKNSVFISIFIFAFTIVTLSGCMDFLNSNRILVYESAPTVVNYTITYGYKVNCTGEGKYSIYDDLDFPEVLAGRILSNSIHNDNYQLINLANNDMIRWDFNSSENTEYELLITAEVNAKSYITTDLNGQGALTIEEIKKQFPNLVNQFCRAQSNETIFFIDPTDPAIIKTSSELHTKIESNNSFLVAKEIFSWLKQHTTYKAHTEDDYEIQSAHTTIFRRTGDCDDLSFLYISLCRSLDIPARFIKGFLLAENNIIQHVWVEVFVGGEIGKNGWIPVECAGSSNDPETEINQNFGVENVDHLRLFLDDGSNESLNISFSGITYRIFSEKRNIDINFYAHFTNYFISKSQQLLVDEKGLRSYI